MTARLLVVAALSAIGCAHHEPAAGALAVPIATRALTVDGAQEGPDWNQRAARVVLAGGDGPARPFSDARFLRDDGALYVGLYAADEDVRSSDAFDVDLGELALRVDVRGRVTPAVPGVKVAIDVDEETTIDRPDDFDEEWKVVLVVPQAALGPHDGGTTAHVARCDTPKDGVTRCGAWSGRLALE